MPPHFVPVSATFISADEGWVLGSAPCARKPCTSIVRTRDGGRTWRGITAPRASEGNHERGQSGAVATIRFADDTDGWTGVADLYSTHDGGASWHKQHVQGQVTHIETGGGYVFVTTDSCVRPEDHCTSRVYASSVGRDDWRDVAQRLPTRSGVTAFAVDGTAWFAASIGGVFHGSGESSPVARRPEPCQESYAGTGSPLLAVASAQDLDAACVSGGAAGTAQYQLFGSTNGGADWRQAGKDSPVRAIAPVSPTTVTAFC